MQIRHLSFGILILLSLASLPSMAAPDEEEVTLQPKDGDVIKVSVKVAKKSETLKNLIEDAGAVELPVPNVRGEILTKIVEFMKYDAEHEFESDKAFLDKLREIWGPKNLSTVNLKEVVDGVNYLDVKRTLPKGEMLRVLPDSLKIYAERLFSMEELEELKQQKDDAAYTSYAQARLLFWKDLQNIIESQNFPGINRVFLDNSPDRRLNALAGTPLGVRQIIALIERDGIGSAEALPKPLQKVLRDWQEDYASKIHFGPMPIEWARWPGHCPLPSDPNYNMYSDNTPEDRFVDNSDGTVTDVCTLLTWEQTPSIPAGPLQQGQNHCAKLDKADITDWRAPTRIELQSIVNYASWNPALNPVFHKGNVRYWSSTPAVAYKGEQAWTIFAAGHVRAEKTSDLDFMRCVHGEQGGEPAAGAVKHYTTTNDSVRDNFTGAEWQRGLDNVEKTPVQALEYCRDLTLERGGWTLPSVKALSTLVDVTRGSPRIDLGAFPGTPETWFWSGSPRVRDPNYRWGVNFSFGNVNDVHVVFAHRVRCVRWR